MTMFMLALSLSAAMTADVHSTFAICPQGSGCTRVERNILARPFVQRGPVVAYSAFAVVDASILLVAQKMRHSDHAWQRKIWWVWPVATMASHTICAVTNSRVKWQP